MSISVSGADCFWIMRSGFYHYGLLSTCINFSLHLLVKVPYVYFMTLGLLALRMQSVTHFICFMYLSVTFGMHAVCCLVHFKSLLSDKEGFYEEVTGPLELMSNN